MILTAVLYHECVCRSLLFWDSWRNFFDALEPQPTGEKSDTAQFENL